MGHYSEDTDARPFDTGSPNRTQHEGRLIDPRDGHPPTTQSSIKGPIMAEGVSPRDTSIPAIPPPPRASTKLTTEPYTDQQQTSESNPQPTETSDASCETVDIAEEVLKQIEETLEDEDLVDIPDVFDNVPIECFCENTQHRLCYHLEPELPPNPVTGYTKDYMGFGEWIGLEALFMKYLHRTVIKHKTIEVLGKWITYDGGRRPTVGNFKECMISGLDRPDVMADLARHIIKDAISWARTGSEACTVPHKKVDKSWQLTRHDVVKGKKTYYTCCLVYADEDEGMAQIITKLYKSVHKEALFFLPQFDLRVGKYEFDTTAAVIQNRCQGRVIFILSEYFFASEVCRFAVQFSRAIDAAADTGNLIPFHLTNQYDHVPRLIKGIAGIRWFRKSARKMSWSQLTDTILGGRMEERKFESLKSRLMENVEREPEVYLCDPPYDKDTPSPGPPIIVHDPPLPEELAQIYDPSSHLGQKDSVVLVNDFSSSPQTPRRMFKAMRKKLDKLFGRKVSK